MSYKLEKKIRKKFWGNKQFLKNVFVIHNNNKNQITKVK